MHPCGALQVRINVIVSGNAHYYPTNDGFIYSFWVLFCLAEQYLQHGAPPQKKKTDNDWNASCVSDELNNYAVPLSLFGKIGLYENKYDNNNSNFFPLYCPIWRRIGGGVGDCGNDGIFICRWIFFLSSSIRL